MIKKLLLLICFIIPTTGAFAETPDDTPDDIIPVEQLLARDPDNTVCATTALTNALAESMKDVDASTDENVIQQIIHSTFTDADVLHTVLACPEIESAADDDSIKFLPIAYTFPAGRTITINYETEPRILKQHLILATRRATPGGGPNPSVGDPDDPTVWTNTDPAWYGILIVEQGTLDEFVGPDKNNTISLKYMEENMGTLRPQGTCTNESALAWDDRNMNVAVRNVVGLGDEDSNDYYVAGNVNLSWIAYAEIALEVVVTVATYGGWAAVSGALKATRAARAMRGLATTMRALQKSEAVTNYLRLLKKTEKATKELNELKKASKATRDTSKIEKLEKEIKESNKTLRKMEKTEDNVKKYNEASKSFSELQKFRHNWSKLRRGMPHRGNIAAKALRFVKAAHTGGSKIDKGAEIARHSMKSGKIRDWLYHSTMRNATKITKLGADASLIYGVLRFAGDMFDYTETSTGQYTNGIEFKPLGLLSADDIPEQDNVVNYGMWLMWLGDSTSAADDDAAYLQAMDFAARTYSELETLQHEKNDFSCNVDIYVVRPIIREPDSENAEMYYLIMNESPWRTTK